MKRVPPPSTQQPAAAPKFEKNRLEIIRFASEVECKLAIEALLEDGMLELTSYSEEEWLVRTPVARRLRDRGVPFEWLTEHA